MTTNNSGSVTLYSVSASYLDDGTRVSCSIAEVLGDAHGQLYASEAESHAVAADLQDRLGASGLDTSTEYRVNEVTVRIADVDCARDRSSDATTVYAKVSINGETYDTRWAARDRVCALGLDGLEPAGDSPDCWLDGAIAEFGWPVAIKIGQEVLAIASSL